MWNVESGCAYIHPCPKTPRYTRTQRAIVRFDIIMAYILLPERQNPQKI